MEIISAIEAAQQGKLKPGMYIYVAPRNYMRGKGQNYQTSALSPEEVIGRPFQLTVPIISALKAVDVFHNSDFQNFRLVYDRPNWVWAPDDFVVIQEKNTTETVPVWQLLEIKNDKEISNKLLSRSERKIKELEKKLNEKTNENTKYVVITFELINNSEGTIGFKNNEFIRSI